jgi:hypothetical protein
MVVLPTDLEEGIAVSRVAEVLHPVSAQERETVPSREPVPQLLEPNGCQTVTVAPEEVHHLAIGAQDGVAPICCEPFHCLPDGIREAILSRQAVVHERFQGLSCIEQRELAGVDNARHVDGSCFQAPQEPISMFRRRDHQYRLLVTQPRRQEVRDDGKQVLLRLEKLDSVPMLGCLELQERVAGPWRRRLKVGERHHRTHWMAGYLIGSDLKIAKGQPSPSPAAA